jgi:excinuclease ABC subunit A
VRILKEIRERLRFLNDVGLDYLTMARNSGTLSGGESQRIRLASQIGSGLTGVLYVLDEPSIGLHQRDNARLLDTLKRLRDLGNTVIVVEHDEDAILHRGPCGRHRARRRHPWRPDRRRGHARPRSWPTRLAHRQVPDGRTGVAAAARAPQAAEGPAMKIVGARGNNLKNVTVDIPLGLFTCRHRRLRRRQVDAPDRHAVPGGRPQAERGERGNPAPHDRIEGIEFLDKVIDIDQSPDRPHAALQPGHLHRRLHADPRMVRRPAGGQGARLRARPLLLQRQGRPLRGLPGRRRHQDRDALPARRLRHLRRLQGKRYNRETLEVQFKGKSIADVLDMTVDEGVEFFKAVPRVRDKLETLREVGLGYIHVGQQATTLSGGEAQRVKLSKELSRRSTGARSTSSTSRPRACISTTWPSCSKCCTSSSTRATRWSSSSTTSKSSRPPTGSSTSGPKAATAAAKLSQRVRRNSSRGKSVVTPAGSSPRCWHAGRSSPLRPRLPFPDGRPPLPGRTDAAPALLAGALRFGRRDGRPRVIGSPGGCQAARSALPDLLGRRCLEGRA